MLFFVSYIFISSRGLVGCENGDWDKWNEDDTEQQRKKWEERQMRREKNADIVFKRITHNVVCYSLIPSNRDAFGYAIRNV